MSKLVVLFILLLTTLFSEEPLESFSFFGLTASHQQVAFDLPVDIDDEKETLGGIRYGQQTLDWRTMFTLIGKEKVLDFSIEIDKILMDDMFGYPEVRPYLGAKLGYLHYEENLIENNDGMYYGGAFGFLIYVTDNIDADISYHYSRVSDIEGLDTLKGPSFGIHYFY